MRVCTEQLRQVVVDELWVNALFEVSHLISSREVGIDGSEYDKKVGCRRQRKIDILQTLV